MSIHGVMKELIEDREVIISRKIIKGNKVVEKMLSIDAIGKFKVTELENINSKEYKNYRITLNEAMNLILKIGA